MIRDVKQHRLAVVIGDTAGAAFTAALGLGVYLWAGPWAMLVFMAGPTAVWSAWRTHEYPWIGRLVGCQCRPCLEVARKTA